MVQSFWHAGLVVGDLEKILEFYVGVLSLEIERRIEFSGERASRLLGFPNLEAKNALVGAGPTHNIEIFQFINPVAAERHESLNSPGTPWLGFMVDDLEALYRNLTAKGIRCVSTPNMLENPEPGRARGVFFAQDPDGNWLEFAERAR